MTRRDAGPTPRNGKATAKQGAEAPAMSEEQRKAVSERMRKYWAGTPARRYRQRLYLACVYRFSPQRVDWLIRIALKLDIERRLVSTYVVPHPHSPFCVRGVAIVPVPYEQF